MKKLISLCVFVVALLFSAEAFATTLIDPSNAAWAYSPWNWKVVSGSATSVNAGAYFKTLFTGTTAVLNFNVSNMGSPISEIYWQIDNGPFTQANVASTVTLTIPSATLSNTDVPYHLLTVIIKSTSETYNRWNTGVTSTAVVFTGLTLDTAASVQVPQVASKNCAILGDSITEGVRTLGQSATNDTDRNDSTLEYSFALGKLLGCEVGIIGFGAQGYITTGNGNVPAFPSTINLMYSGVSRTWSPTPDIGVVAEGGNDGAGNTISAVTSAMNTLTTAWGTSTPVMVFSTTFGSTTQNSNIQAGIAAATNPSQFHFFTMSGVFNTTFGADTLNLHPSGPNATALIAPQVAVLFRPYLYPTNTGGALAY